VLPPKLLISLSL